MRELAMVVALLSCVAAALACGGSNGGLSMEDYVEEVSRALRETDARVEEISGPLEVIGSDEPVDQQVEAARTYLSDLAPIADELALTLRAIDAPSETEEAHRALIAAWEGLRDRAQETLDVLEAAETQEELEGEFGLFLQDSATGVYAACQELQVIAYDANLVADFDCET